MTTTPRHMAPARMSTTARVAIGFAALSVLAGAAGCTANTMVALEGTTVHCQEVRAGVFTVEHVKRGEVIGSRTTVGELLGDDAKVCGL